MQALETDYIYHNKKSPLDGQVYTHHMIDGKVYLRPNGGKAKANLTMKYDVFLKACKDGFYTKK